MSDIFKLRVCIGNANIELEGEGELVHTIFSELRENGLACTYYAINDICPDDSRYSYWKCLPQ